jgi:hypothetical protein
MRNLVNSEIRGLRIKTNTFKKAKWNNVYFEHNGQNINIRNIEYINLSDYDALRLLMFLITII